MNDFDSLTPNERDILKDLMFNEFYHRREILSKLSHGKRDLYQDTGWEETANLTPEMFMDLYERFPVATRVVDLAVDESWRKQPTVWESKDPDNKTAFEQAWDDLDHRLGVTVEKNWFVDDEGSVVWEMLKRVDRLSRIGHYGTLVLELDDVDGENVKWSDPAPGFESLDDEEGIFSPSAAPSTLNAHVGDKAAGTKTRLVGIRAFDQLTAEVIAWYDRGEMEGRPRLYRVKLYDTASTPSASSGAGVRERDVDIHWTRVIHVADNLMSSEYMGTPVMRPVINDLQDLRKIFGASGEGYWRMAFPWLSFESHPNLGSKGVMDQEALREEVERAKNTLERYMATVGGTWKTIAGEVSDPNPHVMARLEAICVYLGCPVRIFKGSERGELASSQDKDAWDERMIARQTNYITPRIIVPFINRLITVGVLPPPTQGYHVAWPDLTTLSLQAKATWAVTQVNAIIKYVAGGGDFLISPKDFLTRVLGFTPQEASDILEATESHLKENPTEDDDVIGRAPSVKPMDKHDDLLEKREGSRTVKGLEKQKAVAGTGD